MKNLRQLFSLLIVLIMFTACERDTETIVIPAYIVGEWEMTGQYIEGVYSNGADCSQLETFILKRDKTGTAHQAHCNGMSTDYSLERRKLNDSVHQIIFTNGNAPWMMMEGEITTLTVVDGKLHLETYDLLYRDEPDRSYRIVVYEKKENSTESF